MPRDQRDPERLWQLIQHYQRMFRTSVLEAANEMTASDLCPNHTANPSCIEKYGRPGDVKVVEDARGPVLSK